MIKQHIRGAMVLGAAVVALGGCPAQQKPCVDQSKPALDKCQTEQAELKKQLGKLKVQLAQALQDPASIEVTDPEVTKIVAELKKKSGGGVRMAEGTLKQSQVIPVLRNGKAGLQACYNKALKRNTALHHSAINLKVSFKVKNTGAATQIGVAPNRDAEMTSCMKRSIRRWKFPSFKGQPVGISAPYTFTPKR